ncbi:ATP-binding protein [Candidatus Venteria ishoeyi]|uniref:Serine/threonine-protein kinase BtrW n=1 Tax=Candidatus Venteria ishoeyi TaxID=1899563 RepID=A0A1H6FCR5_9GAMM|nr:ATP-binding protein [Candidatus Venteria ishoeyi]MDM8546545.1 ATP-binding protein [Candidatus Venteria ishoeyi]SEH07119.1 Serine/threonine-protein kinase BtrW [Candidatus Venteria ishoeyi]
MQKIDLSIHATAENIIPLATCVAGLATLTPLPPQAVQAVHLATVESLNNIIVHAYVDNEQTEHTIQVQVVLQQHRLEIHFYDQGCCVADEIWQAPAMNITLENLDEGGRGITIIQQCIDEIAYQRKGKYNHLCFYKYYPEDNTGTE